MPGVTGVTVVTTLVCFALFRTRGFGCIERPAFPAPSMIEGHRLAKLGRIVPRECGSVSQISDPKLTWLFENLIGILHSTRDCEERLVRRSSTSEGGSDEAIWLAIAGLLRGACHRARLRATRWLAMTVSRRARPQLSSPGLTGRSSIPRRQ